MGDMKSNAKGGFAIDFVRSFFDRDRHRLDNSISTKDLVRAASIGGAGGIDALGMNGIGEMLGLDNRRLHRFSDYESMDEYGDISSSLDIYSDDATQVDGESGKTVWITCQDEDARVELERMFHKDVKIDENVWEMTRTLCKYGNDFEEIVIGDSGVVGLNFLPPATVKRIENNRGGLLGFVQSFGIGDVSVDSKSFEKMKLEKGGAVSPSGDMAVFDDWRVSHMRLRSKHRESMYGWAVTEGARWVWRRLMLLEDAVLVYKLTRSPSRYAFYIDISGLPKNEGERALEKVKNAMKKRKFVNPKTGKLDLRYSPLAFDEDFFLGMRNGQEKTRVETLNGPAYQQVEDVQYFLYKLYAALKVPRAYLGYDENMPSKATLSQEDVRFARTVLRVQREVIGGLHKVGRVHLAARRIDPASVDFQVKMTVPSAIFELGQMEVRRARADLAALMERHVSLYWLLSNVYGLSDGEIEKITKQKAAEQKAAGQSSGGGNFESFQPPERMGITEKELFKGNKEHEKRIAESVKKELNRGDSRIGLQLKETGMLLREILARK